MIDFGIYDNLKDSLNSKLHSSLGSILDFDLWHELNLDTFDELADELSLGLLLEMEIKYN